MDSNNKKLQNKIINTYDISKYTEKLTFALDIGTRSVVGVIGYDEDGIFHVVDYEQILHTKRAMRDGQIEDIDLVADVVKKVKSTLEKRSNHIFTSVSIAAAGRALKTKRVVYEQDLDPEEEISQKLIHAMEYCAVGMVQENFMNENIAKEEPISFYCVGYSVINYQLDDYPFANLLGHKGKKAKIELIAAFLPHNVVQSLYTVTRMNNLNVENLTLEPIAAINVIVPKDIRLLNIAIVDIGAGTSDIAISKNGSIVAYDMVTTAGDEITETIMQHYLTDFETAEEIKISLSDSPNEISFSDILGNTYTELPKKILKILKPAIASLGKSISQRILAINDTPPVAVFLVGGGSQIPGLCAIVAQHLKLAPARVAIGGKQPFKYIKLFTDKLQSPEFITPIGIGAVSSLYKGCDFYSIVVNGKKLMLLNYGNLKVLDALLLASIKPKNLIGVSSKPITYYVNGEKFIKRGNSSTPGELYVNNVPASIDTAIKQGDEIVAIPACDGEKVELKLSDIITQFEPLTLSIDGNDIHIEPIFRKKRKILGNDYMIQPLDNLQMSYLKNIEELFNYLHIDVKEQSITINGIPSELKTPIQSGDVISTQNQLAKTDDTQHCSTEKIPESQNKRMVSICVNDVWTSISSDNKLLFVDMLNYVDIDPKHPKGNIILKLNGKDASYTDPVSDGDVVEIRWDINNAE